jgi:predicted RNase H-like HicB family nuclease
MNLDDLLSVPYVLDARAVQGSDGNWVCELEYEEIPNCVSRARSPLEALDELEQKRVDYLTERFENGLPTPIPRLPLSTPPYGRHVPE